MKIYLISGKARSGKHEVAKLIKKYLENNDETTIITEFSKYIKLYAKEFGLWDGKEETKPRTFLQDMGEFIRKDLDMLDFFINRMKDDMKIFEHYYDNVIIADVRLINEIEKIKNSYNDVYSVHVVSNMSQKGLNEEQRKHLSETELDNYNNFDILIENNYEEDLEIKVNKIMEELK